MTSTDEIMPGLQTLDGPVGPDAPATPDPTFASDNTAGVSPEVLEAITRANGGAAVPYGHDPVTARLEQVVRDQFGPSAEIFPVFNGTGANVVSLQALLPRWGAAICARQAHVNTDEGAAPERLGALKLLARPTPEGKLTPADVEAELGAQGFVHAAQPLAVTLTQSTELGSLYSPAEIAAVADRAHAAGLGVHMDGARLANAAAALGVSLREVTTDVGVDVLSLGGTKNGALAAEAVVVLDPTRVRGTDYIRKYSMQLASKQRFVSAQLLELFGTDLWRSNAEHANAQARLLGERLATLEGIDLPAPAQVNAVFPKMPATVVEELQSRYLFHVRDTAPDGDPVVRLMCSFQTTEAQIDEFVDHARAALTARLPDAR
ncbi:beta-eliminating lyase-related protein [Nesterenkonia sp. CL21]|uniref:threonine aldolase family protein n=1 Tax=Nesterenkonia sp. CL21 TaxID=3064894 RepID=UPI00287A956C|nr:beta-eliminating lyase-related protein [Nesterenkonia sp. CL21]MDS2171960.1 beta-eliminating lyase-related protein [Nesterenkonia sp. CL21]